MQLPTWQEYLLRPLPKSNYISGGNLDDYFSCIAEATLKEKKKSTNNITQI